MYFASDNGAGASPQVLEAVTAAMRAGPVPSYGADAQSKRVERLFCEVFEREVAVFFVASGTATNAMALAHLTPPWGVVYGHAQAHCVVTECGAPEFYSGAKILGLPGVNGKLAPATVEERIRAVRKGDAHHSQPATVTLTNLNECGGLYAPGEVAAFGALARAHGLSLHMDGARFANAIAAAGCTPAEMTWKAGVDALSLGATKGGAIAAEAVVFFDPARAADFHYRRMRGGHLLSKMRFVAAQFEAWFAGGHWLALAGHANAMAKRLGEGLTERGVRLAFPVEGNEVFPILTPALAERVRAAGIAYLWPTTSVAPERLPAQGEIVARLVCSFATTAQEVDAFLRLIEGAGEVAAA
jgi:threonine aldolase